MAVEVAPTVVFAGLLLLLAAATVVRAGPVERSRARWFALAATGLAASLLLAAAPELTPLPGWVAHVRTATFTVSGLALVAFRDAFVPVPTRWWALAIGSAVLAVVVDLSAAAPAGATVPTEVGVAAALPVLVWSLLVVATGVSFWRMGGRVGGTRRTRLRLLGLSAVLLGALTVGAVARSWIAPANVAGGGTTWAGLALVVLLSVALAPPPALGRLLTLASRPPLLADRPIERIALAIDPDEVARIAAQAAMDLVGGDAAFVAVRDELLAVHGIPDGTATRILDWSDRTRMDRLVRIDEGAPVLLLVRPIEPDGVLAVIGGRFTPIFGSEDVAHLDELAALAGLAFTRAQLFEDLRHAKARSDVLVSAISDLGKGVLISDGERLLEVNDAFCELTGRPREELLTVRSRADLVSLLVAPEARRDVSERTERLTTDLRSGPVTLRLQTEFARPDGSRVDVSIALRTVDTADGPRLIGVVRDISDETRATRLLRRRAEQVAALQRVEAAVAGILDREQVLDVVASALTDVLGVRCGALVLLEGADGAVEVRTRGLTAPERLELEDAFTDADTRTLLATDGPFQPRVLALPDDHPFGDPDTIGARLRRGDRTLGVLLVARSSQRSRLDAVDRQTLDDLAVYLSDLLGVVQAYEHERDTVERLRDLDAMRDLVVSAVSHDLREPLAAITALAQTLETRGDALGSDTRTDFAARIRTKAARLIALTADLLDVERLRRDPLTATPAPIRTTALIDAVVEALEPAERERITVTAVDEVVHVDPTRTERILDNLVRNALRYGGDEPVWISAEVVDGSLVLAVEDAGEGVSFEQRARMFEPFEGSGGKGFGLGLAIVERLARAQGGRVRYTDRTGGGARFEVTLPSGALRDIDVTDEVPTRSG